MTKNTVKPVYDLTAMSGRKSIVVTATTQQITDITALLSLDKTNITNLDNDVYELHIDSVKIDVPVILHEMEVDDLDDSRPVRTSKIDSFTNCVKFYSDANKSNGYKIVSDEFSDVLNMELYKGFSLIERKLRQLVLENFQRKGQPTVNHSYKKKNPNHFVSTFQLGEFYEQILKAPASEGYMKAEWRRSTAKDEVEVVRIAKLTRLDEIDPGLTFDELNEIRNQRNKCMHFNVVTITDYKKIVPLMNKYLQLTASRELARSLSGVTKGLRGYLEQMLKDMDISPITKTLSDIAANQQQQTQGIVKLFNDMML